MDSMRPGTLVHVRWDDAGVPKLQQPASRGHDALGSLTCPAVLALRRRGTGGRWGVVEQSHSACRRSRMGR